MGMKIAKKSQYSKAAVLAMIAGLGLTLPPAKTESLELTSKDLERLKATKAKRARKAARGK